MNETTEWSLDQKIFDSIRSKFSDITLDLFASHLNNKMEQYVSWLPDENAKYCDAFTLDWSKFVAYAFPPFNLIGRVLRKVELDKAEIVLLVPEWPSQYWYSKFISMLIEQPYYLPRGT